MIYEQKAIKKISVEYMLLRLKLIDRKSVWTWIQAIHVKEKKGV